MAEETKKVSEKVEKMVEEVAKLTVLELSELVTALQDKLGVSAMPMAATAAPVAAAAAEAAGLGAGCGVMERCMGAAEVGAVEVAGGAEWVFDPRLPALDPPPRRASATAGARASMAARPSARAPLRETMVRRKNEKGDMENPRCKPAKRQHGEYGDRRNEMKQG